MVFPNPVESSATLDSCALQQAHPGAMIHELSQEPLPTRTPITLQTTLVRRKARTQLMVVIPLVPSPSQPSTDSNQVMHGLF